MSLRLRLVGAMLLLTAAGFAAASAATYRFVEDFLLDRFDRELADERFTVFKGIRSPGGTSKPPPQWHRPGDDDGPSYLPVGRDTYAEIRTRDGMLVESLAVGEDDAERPSLPEQLAVPADKTEWWFTAESANGDDYRVYVGPANPEGSELILVAAPLSDVQATLDRLLLVELGVSSAVLIVVGALGYLSVRFGLRPLDRVVETADAIANGDMTRRAPVGSQRTEVGRLGAAFNAMLGAIQESFARRDASEQKLRRFVADASHELRTPLTSLRGFAQVLERPGVSPEDREAAIRRIDEASTRMARLVDDMLLLARLDEEPQLRLAPVDLVDVAATAVAEARAIEPQRPIVLVESSPAIVEGDRDHLVRAVANLLANVRVHTGAGVPARVRVGRVDGWAFVEVSDDGPGIPPAASDKLFERFFRVDKSRSRASGGAGLGLSIVAGIAEAHGGHVVMESEPGRGASFRISLPLAAEERE